MNFIQRWRAKRQLKKAAKFLEQLAAEAPASFFNITGYSVTNPRTGLRAKDHIEARNNLMAWAAEVRRGY